MLRRISALLLLAALPAAAEEIDPTDHEAVCRYTAEAADVSDPVAFIPVCTCAYGVLEEELGAELVTLYVRFELGEGALADLLPEGMTEDAFFERIAAAAPAIDAACAG